MKLPAAQTKAVRAHSFLSQVLWSLAVACESQRRGVSTHQRYDEEKEKKKERQLTE